MKLRSQNTLRNSIHYVDVFRNVLFDVTWKLVQHVNVFFGIVACFVDKYFQLVDVYIELLN
jgi:hypothetical protein